MNPDLVYMMAGELSGDQLGGQLIQALRGASPKPLMFAGVGGGAMQAAGLPSLFPLRDLSVMGFAEIIPRLPTLLARIKQTQDDIIARQPRVVVSIDSPGFTLRVIRKVRAQCPHTKFIHYVAPQVWAWKPERAKTLGQVVDAVMCLLPFEPAYFGPHGLRSEFTGHPAIDIGSTPISQQTRQAFFEKYNLSLMQPPTILSVLFGSREGEVRRLAPVFYETAYRLLHEWPNLAVLVPTLPHLWDHLKPLIGADQRFIPVDPEDRFDAFALSHAALAASGTVGLELAMMGVPHIVAYKFAPLTYFIGKRLVTTQHMHLCNILLNKRVIPEFLQHEAVGRVMTQTMLDLLVNRNGVATQQRQAFTQVRTLLKGEGLGAPSQQAAALVLSYMA